MWQYQIKSHNFVKDILEITILNYHVDSPYRDAAEKSFADGHMDEMRLRHALVMHKLGCLS